MTQGQKPDVAKLGLSPQLRTLALGFILAPRVGGAALRTWPGSGRMGWLLREPGDGDSAEATGGRGAAGVSGWDTAGNPGS